MNKKKNHNSIIFLTTLSVYLGLVLVGGTVPVLAHSALTRDFDIKNEIVFEDDLDKKPNDKDLAEDVEIIKNLKIAEAITNFVADLKKLEIIGKFNPKEDLIFSHQLWQEHFDGTYSISHNSDISNPWLKTAVSELISIAEPEYLYTISDKLPNCDGYECREKIVKVESTGNDFSLSFTFTKSTAEKAKFAAEAFGKVFLSQKESSKNTINLPIYENTKATSENNQVFIVTRLPRASIDALLAEKDAQ